MNNYQKHQFQIQNIKGRPSLLLHICCGVCSVYPLVYLRQFFDITIFFSNSNIYPYEEFEKRYNNSQRELDYISNEYDNLKSKLNEFKDFIKQILQLLKQFFKNILLSKNDNKNDIINIIKDCYDNNLYNSTDLRDISNNTDYEEEVNNLINSKEVEKDYDIFI